MKSQITILLILLSFAVQAQNDWDNLILRKSFHDKLDDCIFQYEQFGFLDGEEKRERFADLFTDSATIEDYINPIVTKRKVEFQKKTLANFITDFTSTFKKGFEVFKLTGLNYDNLFWTTPDLSKKNFSLIVHQSVRAIRSDGSILIDNPELQFEFVYDTLQNEVINLRIDKIKIFESNISLEKKVTKSQINWSFELNTIFSFPIVSSNSLGIIKGHNGSFSSIINPITSSQSQIVLNSKDILGLGGSLIRKLDQPVGKELSVSFGLRYERARYNLKAPFFESTFDDEDIEKDAFIHIIEGSNIEEEIIFQSVKVPIRIRIERELTNSGIGWFFHGGINLGLIFSSKFEKIDGLLDHSAFYPQFGNFVITDDVPELGLLRDSTTHFRGEYNFKKFNTEFVVSTGFSFRLTKESPWHIYLALNANLGLINAANLDEAHLPTRNFQEYQGLGPWIDELRFSSIGFNISIRRKFKLGIVKFKTQKLDE